VRQSFLPACGASFFIPWQKIVSIGRTDPCFLIMPGSPVTELVCPIAVRLKRPICGRRIPRWRDTRGSNRSSEARHEFRGKCLTNQRRSVLHRKRVTMQLPHILPAANRCRESLFCRSVRALSTFPSKHHPVSYGQADILNAGVGLNETVKGDNRVSISIPGLYHFATPQNIVANDQPARFK